MSLLVLINRYNSYKIYFYLFLNHLNQVLLDTGFIYNVFSLRVLLRT